MAALPAFLSGEGWTPNPKRVLSGEFGSTSEVVREAMRRYVAEDTQLEALRREIQKGLDSGPARPFDIDAWFEEKFGSE